MSTLKMLLFACAAHALPHSESGALPAHILKVREEKVAEAAVPEIKGVAQLSASDIADVVLHKMEEKEAGAKAAADVKKAADDANNAAIDQLADRIAHKLSANVGAQGIYCGATVGDNTGIHHLTILCGADDAGCAKSYVTDKISMGTSSYCCTDVCDKPVPNGGDDKPTSTTTTTTSGPPGGGACFAKGSATACKLADNAAPASAAFEACYGAKAPSHTDAVAAIVPMSDLAPGDVVFVLTNGGCLTLGRGEAPLVWERSSHRVSFYVKGGYQRTPSG